MSQKCGAPIEPHWSTDPNLQSYSVYGVDESKHQRYNQYSVSACSSWNRSGSLTREPILGFSLFQLESKWQPDTGNFLRTPTLVRSNSRCRLNSVHHTRKESKRHQNSNIRLALTHISYFTAIEFAAPDHIPMIRLTASKLETEHPAVVTLHKKTNRT